MAVAVACSRQRVPWAQGNGGGSAVTDENCAKTVTIIGAGIGGLYLIAELGVAGFKLRLHDIDD